MKILMFTSVLSGGGAERVLCELANNFSFEIDWNQCYTVNLLTFSLPSTRMYFPRSETICFIHCCFW